MTLTTLARDVRSDPARIAEIARKLTKARKRAIIEGQYGYCDDDSLTGSERRMFNALVEQGLFCRPGGTYFARQPDLRLTPLGLAVRQHLAGQP